MKNEEDSSLKSDEEKTVAISQWERLPLEIFEILMQNVVETCPRTFWRIRELNSNFRDFIEPQSQKPSVAKLLCTRATPILRYLEMFKDFNIGRNFDYVSAWNLANVIHQETDQRSLCYGRRQSIPLGHKGMTVNGTTVFVIWETHVCWWVINPSGFDHFRDFDYTALRSISLLNSKGRPDYPCNDSDLSLNYDVVLFIGKFTAHSMFVKPMDYRAISLVEDLLWSVNSLSDEIRQASVVRNLFALQTNHKFLIWRFVDNRTEFIYQLEFPLDTCSKLITLWIDPGSMAPSVTNIRIVARREEFQVTVAWRKLPIPFEAFDDLRKARQALGHEYDDTEETLTLTWPKPIKPFVFRDDVCVILEASSCLQILVKPLKGPPLQGQLDLWPVFQDLASTVHFEGGIFMIGTNLGSIYCYNIANVTDLVTLKLEKWTWEYQPPFKSSILSLSGVRYRHGRLRVCVSTENSILDIAI